MPSAPAGGTDDVPTAFEDPFPTGSVNGSALVKCLWNQEGSYSDSLSVLNRMYGSGKVVAPLIAPIEQLRTVSKWMSRLLWEPEILHRQRVALPPEWPSLDEVAIVLVVVLDTDSATWDLYGA